MQTMKQLDLNTWITQQALADQLGVRVQNVHNWVRRGKIDFQKLPGSKIILVNKNSVVLDDMHYKRRGAVT
jgi:predicted site-specific integrase-resolvase